MELTAKLKEDERVRLELQSRIQALEREIALTEQTRQGLAQGIQEKDAGSAPPADPPGSRRERWFYRLLKPGRDI